MNLLGLASRELRHAADIVDKIEKLKEELEAALNSSDPAQGRGRKKRKMSDAGRLAIAAAQKLRWSTAKAESVFKPAVRRLARRTMSAAARSKIAAAAKARWAKAKAAGKKSL